MGRAPCCDKANVKKGPWSPEEDSILKSYIEQHGTGGNWIALPQKIGLKRCGKSCRLRWLNYLRPNIKHGGFSEEEDNIICSLYISIGSRWSIIAAQLPGRTDNDIKNYWNTRLKKKLLGKQRKIQQARRSIIPNPAEIKKENIESSSFDLLNPESAFIMNQTRPYWPDLSPTCVMPVLDPYLDDSQALKDQNSLKNLLFKLGGKFSESSSNFIDFQYPIDISNCGQLDYYGTSFNSTTTTTTTTSCVHDQFDTDFQGLENLQAELNELIYINPQPLDEPDQSYFNGWDYMGNGSTRTSSASAETSGTTWGEINSSNNFICPRLVSDCEITYQRDNGSGSGFFC